MSDRYNRRPRRPRRRRARSISCLGRYVLLGVLLLLLVEGYMTIVRPYVSDYIGQQVSSGMVAPARVADPAQQRELQERIELAQQTLPTVIAAMPQGELRISESQANAFLAANDDYLDPIESLTVRFLPGQVQANLRLFGMQGQLGAGLAASDGQLFLVDPRLEGPLSYLFSIDEVVRPIERQLNNELLTQGQHIRDVRIEQGQLVLLVERV